MHAEIGAVDPGGTSVTYFEVGKRRSSGSRDQSPPPRFLVFLTGCQDSAVKIHIWGENVFDSPLVGQFLDLEILGQWVRRVVRLKKEKKNLVVSW